jgi:uncharacterized protein
MPASGACRSIAPLLFAGPTLEREDRRLDYGEQRIVATGSVGGRVLTCVYTDRVMRQGLVRRIVSLRAASRRERHHYVDQTQAIL